MEQIEEYIKKTQVERQKHLELDEPCLERGGQSMYLKGLLAHLRETTIPSGKKIHVCHACHNAKCSNPNHIYWGTPSENRQDAIANGALKSPYEYSVAKYGLEEANRRNARGGNVNGKGNKGKMKSKEHKQKISDGIKLKNYLVKHPKQSKEDLEIVDAYVSGNSIIK